MTATVIRPTHPHPVAFMILILPWGIMTGYIGMAVAYFLAQALMSWMHGFRRVQNG
jgi:hypothetical protein